VNASGCRWSRRGLVQLLSRLVLTIHHCRFGTRDLKGVERRFGIVHVSREDTAFSFNFCHILLPENHLNCNLRSLINEGCSRSHLLTLSGRRWVYPVPQFLPSKFLLIRPRHTFRSRTTCITIDGTTCPTLPSISCIHLQSRSRTSVAHLLTILTIYWKKYYNGVPYPARRILLYAGRSRKA
jgi:hypothetical protein